MFFVYFFAYYFFLLKNIKKNIRENWFKSKTQAVYNLNKLLNLKAV